MPGRKLARLVVGSFLLAVALPACRPSAASLEPGDSENPIAEEFKTFWEESGGLTTFGPPLEPARRRGGVLTQTFLAVQLTYLPGDEDRPVRLAPLSRVLGLAEPASPPIDGQSGQYYPETGHTLYTGFASLFTALGGIEVVGPPVSEVRFRGGRITQYFENLGMVRPENASPSEVRLVALGLALQPDDTAFGIDIEDVILPGVVRERPFSAALDAFGGEAVLGQPLTDPYRASDGDLEQVYERAVVHAANAGSTTVGFRPVGLEWWSPAPPSPESDDPGALYDDATGHNILYAFADFYREFEGEVLLGAPIEEMRIDGSGLAQRFENGELVYRYDLPPELAVQLTRIGKPYLELHPVPPPDALAQPPETTPSAAPQISAEAGPLRLQVTLAASVVHPQGAQEVSILITLPDGSPVAGLRPQVAWYALGSRGNVLAPESDEEGRTAVQIQVDSSRPFEIVNVVVSIRDEGGSGSAAVQFAIGLPEAQTPRTPAPAIRD